MAFDKMVDSAVLDGGLKKIADAIREKSGSADALAFPDEMEAAVKAIEGGGVQSDLNQNDPTKPDYVKNRTHYSEIKEVVVECVGEAGEVELDNFPKFTVGDTVGVIVDDVEHLLVAFDDGGYPTIGDAYDDVMDGIGEFGWYIYVGGDSVCFGAYVAPHTIRYPGKVVEYVWEPGEVLLDNFPEFAVGDTVTVTVDGSEHTLIAFKDYSGPVIGDPIDAVFDGTGELGWFISCGLEGGIWFVALGPHTIRYGAEVVHKLDDKYVPVIPRNRIENGEHLCFDITGYMTDLWLETELSDGSFVYTVDPSVNFNKTPSMGLMNTAYPGIAVRGSVGLYFVSVTAMELQVDGIRKRNYVFVHSDAVEEGIEEYKEVRGIE